MQRRGHPSVGVRHEVRETTQEVAAPTLGGTTGSGHPCKDEVVTLMLGCTLGSRYPCKDEVTSVLGRTKESWHPRKRRSP